MCEMYRSSYTMALVYLVLWLAAVRALIFQARMKPTREKCGWSLRIGLTDSEDFYMSVCEIDPVVDGIGWANGYVDLAPFGVVLEIVGAGFREVFDF